MNATILHVPPCEVELETGDVVSVAAFSIQPVPVSRQEFAEFVDATGYVTTCERLSVEDPALTAIEERGGCWRIAVSGGEFPVVCSVSHVDATAYCKWKGVRLPTEAEWVAFALRDRRIYQPVVEGREFMASMRELHKLPIVFHGLELTSTMVAPGRYVERGGPHYIRPADWKSPHWVAAHRRIEDETDFICVKGFRVVVE